MKEQNIVLLCFKSNIQYYSPVTAMLIIALPNGDQIQANLHQHPSVITNFLHKHYYNNILIKSQQKH